MIHSTAFSFPSASDARNGARKNIQIFNEVRSIEYDILVAIENGLLSISKSDTVMTNTAIPTPFTVSAVNTTTDTFTTSSPHGLINGNKVRMYVSTFSSYLPSPISQHKIYYANVTSANTFRLCNTESDAIAGTNIIDLSSTYVFTPGTVFGKHVIDSELYYLSWREIVPDRLLNERMNSVIQYFKNLGYYIARRPNPATSERTFYWYLEW